MKYFFLTLSVVVLLASCAKTPTINNNRQSALRKGTWKVTSGTLTLRKPNGVDTTLNYMDWIPDCHRDDYVRFDSLNIAYIFPGSTKCDPSAADSTKFLWKLENGETTMSLYNGFSNTFGVVESIVLPFYFNTEHDSTWNLRFTPSTILQLDIYAAGVTNFSSSSFTLNYAAITTYPDSTGHHTGYDATNNIDMDPIIRPDTVHYSVTYSAN